MSLRRGRTWYVNDSMPKQEQRHHAWLGDTRSEVTERARAQGLIIWILRAPATHAEQVQRRRIVAWSQSGASEFLVRFWLGQLVCASAGNGSAADAEGIYEVEVIEEVDGPIAVEIGGGISTCEEIYEVEIVKKVN